VPLIEDQPDSLWMQVHERLVYGTGALSPVAGRWRKIPISLIDQRSKREIPDYNGRTRLDCMLRFQSVN
jgi:hypothetical protein